MAGLIILGQPHDPNEELPRLLLTLTIGSIATIAFALVGGYWLASRAMAPVRTTTRTARGISETDLNKRLRLGKRDELGELANTFDAMLDRFQAAFDRQRQFTADASHELRTPLTIVSIEAEQTLARRRSEVELTLGELPEAKVQGDRQYLSQAISNLVENAIKYAGGRGKHVCIETGTRQAGGQRRTWMRVEDDGPGIPGKHLVHLSDRFYRVDKARTRSQNENNEADPAKASDGSGLGLSIVQWIADAHGGKVKVESLVGEGTAFEIELPGAIQT